MNRIALAFLLTIGASSVAFAECPDTASAQETPEQKVDEMVKEGAKVRSPDGGTVTVPSTGMALPSENWFTPEKHSDIAAGGDEEVERAEADAEKREAEAKAAEDRATDAECG